MNRKNRRASERNGAKLMQGAKTKFEKIDFENMERVPEGVNEIYRNNYYFLFVWYNIPTTKGEATKVLIRANDHKPIKNHWREIQNIKNEIFGKEKIAIEYYPPESDLVDMANIYWIWIFPDGVLPTPIL